MIRTEIFFSDHQHKANCSHGQHLPQEQPAQKEDVSMYHHCSDVHADDRKQTLKNNIQPHPSKDPNNDHTERSNEENNISVSIEDTFEIGKKNIHVIFKECF